MKNVCWIALILLVMVPAMGGAQTADDQYDYKGGDKEFTFVGGGNSGSDFEGNIVSLEGRLGYFFSEYFAFNIRQACSYMDFVNAGNGWTASTRLGLDVNFDFNRFKPFLGASFGGVYGDYITERFIAGPEVGFKYFVNSTTYFLTLVEYQFLFDDVDEADDHFDDGSYEYTFGLGFRF